jgi:hypothetical protein
MYAEARSRAGRRDPPRRNRRATTLSCLLAVAAVLSPPAAAEQQGDPLKSPACRAAVDALQVREAEARAERFTESPADRVRQRDATARLQAARKQAAQACLRGSGDPPPPASVAPPPVAVPPIDITAPPRPPLPLPGAPAASAPAAAAAAPPRPQPPPIVTSCDAAGCWTSDGKWLPRAGQTLIGPRGPCTVQGVLLNCP